MFKQSKIILQLIMGFILLDLIFVLFTSLPNTQAVSPEQLAEIGACTPNSGWTWGRGAEKPQIANLIEQSLNQQNINADVRATAFGETDSCGTFAEFGVDFDIEVQSISASKMASTEEVAYTIMAQLPDFVGKQLGNTKISFPDADPIHFRGVVIDHNHGLTNQRQFVSTATDNFQVDATKTWQDTGVAISADTLLHLQVVDGLWTHWKDFAPYNNGHGGGFICGDPSCGEPLPYSHQGALIGRVGNHVFEIGFEGLITTEDSGNLELRINDADNGLFDNDGILTVEMAQPEIDPSYVSEVYVVVYDPLLSNGQLLSEYLHWSKYEDQIDNVIEFFLLASNGELLYEVVDTTVITSGWPEKIDGFVYTEETYLAMIEDGEPAHQPDLVNYNKIVNDPMLDICGRVNRGEIDEVWIFNGPYFGFWESTLVGPGSYTYNSPPVPEPYDCERLIPIMGPSPEREGLYGHNEGHRMEATMTHVYGGWEQNRTSHSWDRFGLVDFQSSDYEYSGCGSVHYPANGIQDYDYANKDFANTYCEDFVNYPHLTDPESNLDNVNCHLWGCFHDGFMRYWFGHLPSNFGCGNDDVSSNWWTYFVDPAEANNLPCEVINTYLPLIRR